MSDTARPEIEGTEAEIRDRLLDAALFGVAFDGWSDGTFRAACADAGIDPAVARAVCPRGALDLALAYHERGDRLMMERLSREDLAALRLRDRIALAIRYRIEAIDDKEAVRRGSALFSLPGNAADGARAIWGTADRIWTALGDHSDDINWYTKRASLAGVYGSTVLFWLGDDSENCAATWEFMDRRVADVLNLEKVRAQVTGNPVLKRVFAGPNWLAGRIRAPGKTRGFPGSWEQPVAPTSGRPTPVDPD
ncbi:ubiquinone biosynthesis protein COQ9 [Aliiruegeria haliotis]|uniref:Ubiquinone biosynthesis protein COQ9 n=1 Tax=Aliiruegeria haliotis TaxID=1280846 RepID=A0A2T0RTN3_9RHOB|nr:COQ9 family protein [Aliiruegeria haliotis]PRY24497.1 ubiquinone biosynthesis protein COQ9 [Aliiruegeria haliotis]